ncbi:MAG: heme lyase CcmF/NrfE family subunit [Lysobacteraceae bacterium]|nr:MAG: heme lyase CcmF/NrfE family subunit [Xanthomonadaceae bacterium]
MIPEFGQVVLILALLMAIVQAMVPLIGAHRCDPALMAIGLRSVYLQAAAVVTAFTILSYLMLAHDFSVNYVAQNSNLRLPWYYRLSGVWGAHEGSLLLWVLILNLWSVAVAWAGKGLPQVFHARVLSVLGMIGAGFLAFTLFTSNPFERIVPVPADGHDLNPLLQDFGLIVHPPMLYTGYVGFSVAFAFAIAALLGGEVDRQWVRWSRPWTNVAWATLTLGIAMGSWWAYYELGWGGWWFWDPVENASFMPWLAGTALIHSQAVTEKRGGFRAWTQLLAILAFSFSLLGTFLVRSGVLTSVHAFATDPGRGMFILGFLGVVVGGSLLLYSIRAPKVAGGRSFAGISRDSLLLANNLVFVCAAGMVLLGTLYPLIGDVLGLGKISVGPPYFGNMFLWMMVPIAIILPFGPFLRWGKDDLRAAARRLWPAFAAAAVSCAVGAMIFGASWKALLGMAAFGWIAAGVARYAAQRARAQPASARFNREMVGMLIAHAGIAVFFAGVLVTEGTSIEKDLRIAQGETVMVGGYAFRFEGIARTEGPNYIADEATIRVSRGGREVAVLHPQKRQYSEGSNVQTEAAIAPGLLRDIYVAMGEPLGNGDAWAVRIYLKSFVRWIWAGALLMMLGGLIAASAPRFYRLEDAVAPPRTVRDDVVSADTPASAAGVPA